MTLLELLVKELPRRGGWPSLADNCQPYKNEPKTAFFFDRGGFQVRVPFIISTRGVDLINSSPFVTREQYEAAIAAQQPIAKFHSRTFPSFKAITVFERDDSWVGMKVDGEAYHCYKRHWDIEFISEQPAWDGEGLPPVGVKCEWYDKNIKKWFPVKVVYSSEWVLVVRGAASNGDVVELGIERFVDADRCNIRPIRTEADRNRESAINAMTGCLGKSIYVLPKEAAEILLDTIAAGKIPGVELTK